LKNDWFNVIVKEALLKEVNDGGNMITVALNEKEICLGFKKLRTSE
jgi:hypothetical protein